MPKPTDPDEAETDALIQGMAGLAGMVEGARDPEAGDVARDAAAGAVGEWAARQRPPTAS